jgi:hypothetical protein
MANVAEFEAILKDFVSAPLAKMVAQTELLNHKLDKLQRTRTVKVKADLPKEVEGSGLEKSIGGMVGRFAPMAAGALGAIFAVDKIKEFGMEVINTTGKFQKYEAVLSNTVGSKALADAYLTQLTAFAAQTPFSVDELTNSFIKLANRGIRPSLDTFRAVGDFSGVLGKSFDQVVEAILDINNQVRWKEIGVKAETSGNKVKLTFKGMTQEVERTEAGVLKAIEAFGKMQGVAGTMEAVSQTIVGRISNMGDAWEQFMNTIGKTDRGAIGSTIGWLTEMIQGLEERYIRLFYSVDQRADLGANEIVSRALGNFQAGDKNAFRFQIDEIKNKLYADSVDELRDAMKAAGIENTDQIADEIRSADKNSVINKFTFLGNLRKNFTGKDDDVIAERLKNAELNVRIYASALAKLEEAERAALQKQPLDKPAAEMADQASAIRGNSKPLNIYVSIGKVAEKLEANYSTAAEALDDLASQVQEVISRAAAGAIQTVERGYYGR